jgi:hypothetical protein
MKTQKGVQVWLNCFFNLGGSWGTVIKATPQQLNPPGNKPGTLITMKDGWAPGPVWTGAEYFDNTGIRFPDRPTSSEYLYRLIYPGTSRSRKRLLNQSPWKKREVAG